MSEVQLDQLDRDEWFDVCRVFKPQLTREEFGVAWETFQQLKLAHNTPRPQ